MNPPSANKMQTYYQISQFGQYTDQFNSKIKKDAIIGSSTHECLQNLIKRLMKHINCRRYIFDHFEKMIMIELREYNKKEKIFTLLNRMYERVNYSNSVQQEQNDVLKSKKSNNEVMLFDTFIQHVNSGEKKLDEGKLNELKKIYLEEDIVNLVDERALILTYSIK